MPPEVVAEGAVLAVAPIIGLTTGWSKVTLHIRYRMVDHKHTQVVYEAAALT